MTMSAARSHLRPVGRQPAYLQGFAHPHFDEQLAQQQYPLPAEAGYLDLDFFKVMRAFLDRGIPRSIFRSDLQNICNRPLRWVIDYRILWLAIAKNIQRKVGNHLFEDPSPRFDRIFSPDGWARRKDFDKRKAPSVALNLQRFPNRTPRLHDVLVVGERDPFDVGRRLERGQQFRHVQRKPFVRWPAAPGRSCALLAD